MKILYGVQGTGNGHISRARAMARAFAASNASVDYLFSGRALDGYFAMECFDDFQLRRGLTFTSRGGCVSYLRTALHNNYWHFLRDVSSLDISGYDLLLTDFEPITAWAGWLRGKTVVSLGHQPAFDYSVPVAGQDLRSRLVMRMFAPGSLRIGMHWDSFGAPILPPIVNLDHAASASDPRKVLVYLPFEDQEKVRTLLMQIPEYDFYLYAPGSERFQTMNLHCCPTSLEGFQADLASCSAVMCNAGFELSSECLVLGKRLLVKPLGRQMEQSSNALALQTLGFGTVLETLDVESIRSWLLSGSPPTQIDYPDVAGALVNWLSEIEPRRPSLQALSEGLWAEVRLNI